MATVQMTPVARGEHFDGRELIQDNWKAEIPIQEDYKLKVPPFVAQSLMNPRRKTSNVINTKVFSDGNIERDFVNFYIKVLEDENGGGRDIQFMAYLDPISDSYGANWQSETFAGRGEEFFRYTGFTRSISFGFYVVVEDIEHLPIMYKKLNFLTSLTAPNYSSYGFMKGNIIKLTVGDYINNLPGVITGLTLDIGEDSTWEVEAAQLPLMIKVNGFNFKPIHRNLPQLGGKFIDSPLDEVNPKTLSNTRFNKYYKGPNTISPQALPVSSPTLVPRNIRLEDLPNFNDFD